MKFLLASALVATGFARMNGPANNPDLIRMINKNPTSTWKAGHNGKFHGITIQDAKRFLGAIRDPARVAEVKKGMKAYDGPVLDAASIPTDFDVRAAWPAAANITGHIADQSACGSCWAVSSTTAFNDRLAISYNFTTQLSELDTTACCSGFSSGCDGGFPDEAWQYFASTGCVTGGDYGSGVGCAPYSFPQCSHHVSGSYPPCPSTDYNTPNCPTACTNSGYNGKWATDKHTGKTAYNLQSVEAAQTDIMAKGSITATFDVYEDFLTYKSGVYQYTSGQLLGGHAVRIVGWGTDSGTPYWLVANSWNPTWGDNGLFKILRGQDECGIEDDLGAGDV